MNFIDLQFSLHDRPEVASNLFMYQFHVQIKQNTSILEEKARRFWRYNTLAKIIAAWKDYAEEEKVQGWHKERRSREHSVT